MLLKLVIPAIHRRMIGRYYQLEDDESEIKEIEKDLAHYIDVPFVKCSYDSIYSHKHIQKEEAKYRKKMGEENGFWFMCDYIINYEKYKTKEDYEANNGGYDGEVYELHYLKGNGNYIVITDTDDDK